MPSSDTSFPQALSQNARRPEPALLLPLEDLGMFCLELEPTNCK